MLNGGGGGTNRGVESLTVDGVSQIIVEGVCKNFTGEDAYVGGGVQVGGVEFLDVEGLSELRFPINPGNAG